MKPTQIVSILFAVITAVMFTCTDPVQGQSFSFTTNSDEGEIFMLQEMGGIIQVTDKGATVQMIMPAEQRSEKYQDVDLKIGDIIKMVNGKKIDSAESLQKLYDDLKVGDEIKAAIMRDKVVHIISFPKGEKDPNMMMQTVTIDGNASGEGEMKINEVTKPRAFLGSAAIVQEAGLILGNSEDNLTVVGTMNMGEDLRQKAGIVEGDQVAKIQDKAVSTVDEFNAVYESVKAGEQVRIDFAQKDGVKFITFTKTDAPKKIMMKKSQ